MRLELITPESEPSRRLRRWRLIQFPQLTMPLIAALTPPDIEVHHTDEIVEPVDLERPVDLVAITCNTPAANHSSRLAGEFRRRGRQMSPESLEQGVAWFAGQFYSLPSICERLLRRSRVGLWWNLPRNPAYRLARTGKIVWTSTLSQGQSRSLVPRLDWTARMTLPRPSGSSTQVTHQVTFQTGLPAQPDGVDLLAVVFIGSSQGATSRNQI